MQDEGNVISGQLFLSDNITPTAGQVKLSISGSNGTVSRPTSEDGNFKFVGLENTTFHMHAVSKYGRSKTVVVELNENFDKVRLVIQKGGTIEGRVIVDHETLAEPGSVYANGNTGPGLEFETKLTEDGSFTLHGLPKGKMNVNVFVGGLEASKTVWLDEYAYTVFDLLEQRELSGKIFRNGNPSANVYIDVQPIDSQTTFGSTFSSSSGFFRISGLESGQYKVKASGAKEKFVSIPQEQELNIELYGLRISGKIIDGSSRKLMPGAQINVMQGASVAGSVISDSLGEFVVEDLKSGDYKLSIYKQEYEILIDDVFVTGSSVEQNFLLQPSDQLPIQIIDRITKAPISDVLLIAESFLGISHRSMIKLHPGSNGRYYLPPSLINSQLTFTAWSYRPHTLSS